MSDTDTSTPDLDSALQDSQPETEGQRKHKRRKALRDGTATRKRKRGVRLPSFRTGDDDESKPNSAELSVIRDARGKVLPGSSSPGGGAVAAIQGLREKLRWELVSNATPEHVRAVADALLRKALKGDVFAAREWLDRTVGRVQDAPPGLDLPRIVLEISGSATLRVESPQALDAHEVSAIEVGGEVVSDNTSSVPLPFSLDVEREAGTARASDGAAQGASDVEPVE